MGFYHTVRCEYSRTGVKYAVVRYLNCYLDFWLSSINNFNYILLNYI